MRTTLLLILLLTLLCTACESSDTKAAKLLLQQAEALYQQEQYTEAIQVLDSLHATYPQALAQREVALIMARSAKLAKSRADSALLAPQLEEALAKADALYQDFVLVEAPGMPDENIIRYKGYNPSQHPEQPFLDIYIDSKGQLDLVAGISATYPIKSHSIKVVNPQEGTYLFSDTLTYDGGTNYRYNHLGRYYERLTFTNESAAKVAAFIYGATEGTPLRIEFGTEGKGTPLSFTLTKEATTAIAHTYTYYQLLEFIKEGQLQLDRHQQRLLNHQLKQK